MFSSHHTATAENQNNHRWIKGRMEDKIDGGATVGAKVTEAVRKG